MMQREIKFRGLRTDGKGWVYGSLVNNGFFNSENKESIPYIFNPEECHDAYGWEDFDDDYGYYSVIPESIGQFTGLKDKNGTDIYKGDIVVSFKESYEDNPSTNIVELVRGCFMLVCIGKNDIPLFNYNPENLEVISNIHEQKSK